jgi:uncharacterized coiled-coil protein SlyX
MQDRIEALEVKLAYMENTVADLDEVVRLLGDKVDGVRAELKVLREQMVKMQDDEERDPEAEVPPHY